MNFIYKPDKINLPHIFTTNNRIELCPVHLKFVSVTRKREINIIKGVAGTNEKGNYLEEFTAMTWGSSILLANKNLPLGECSTEILNLSDDFIRSIVKARNELVTAFSAFRSVEKNTYSITLTQRFFNNALDLIVSIPPYKYFLEKDYHQNKYINTFNAYPDKFLEQCELASVGHGEIIRDFELIISVLDDVVVFKQYFSIMLDLFFEDLKKRNAEFYAHGFYNFLVDPTTVNKIAELFPKSKSFEFMQKRSVSIEYAPMNNPENKKEYIIAERVEFNSLISFLHLDFFRALINGQCPRKCHNCGEYFLLLSGHNTRYCSNIAPDEKSKAKNKTCRDVGAHNKELEAKEKRTPAQVEYDKAYNRLKARKSRKKINDDEWNDLVNKALDLKEQNEKGLLSDFEYLSKMEKI